MKNKKNNFYLSHNDKLVHECLDKYLDEEPCSSVPRINITLIAEINEYTDKYVYFQKITAVILEFFKNMNNVDRSITSKFMQIKSSVRKQKELLMCIKKVLKQHKLEKEYYDAIRVTTKKISDRINYLLKSIVQAYIDITPLKTYSDMLAKSGKTLYEDMEESIDIDEMKIASKEPAIISYVEKVTKACEQDDTWKQNLEKYNNFLQQKQNSIEEEKEKAKLETRKRQQETTMQMLIEKSRNILNNFQKEGMNDSVNGDMAKIHTSFRRLGARLQELPKDERHKIILFAKTSSGINASLWYYADCKDMKSPYIGNAIILKEHEPIPDYILEKSNTYEIAYVELMID